MTQKRATPEDDNDVIVIEAPKKPKTTRKDFRDLAHIRSFKKQEEERYEYLHKCIEAQRRFEEERMKKQIECMKQSGLEPTLDMYIRVDLEYNKYLEDHLVERNLRLRELDRIEIAMTFDMSL